MGLGEHARLVGDVHRDVLAPDEIEAAVGVGKIGDAALPGGDRPVQPAERVQAFRRGDVFGSNVDRRHRAAMVVREIARRAADAAAGIEHAHPFRYAGELGQHLGLRQPAAVQLVDVLEHFDGWVPDVLAVRFERGEDTLDQTFGTVERLDRRRRLSHGRACLRAPPTSPRPPCPRGRRRPSGPLPASPPASRTAPWS